MNTDFVGTILESPLAFPHLRYQAFPKRLRSVDLSQERVSPPRRILIHQFSI